MKALGVRPIGLIPGMPTKIPPFLANISPGAKNYFPAAVAPASEPALVIHVRLCYAPLKRYTEHWTCDSPKAGKGEGDFLFSASKSTLVIGSSFMFYKV